MRWHSLSVEQIIDYCYNYCMIVDDMNVNKKTNHVIEQGLRKQCAWAGRVKWQFSQIMCVLDGRIDCQLKTTRLVFSPTV